MKRVKKIFKWIGIILLLIIVSITIITVSRQHLHYTAPYPDIKASTDSAVIAKGRHFVMGPAHCIYCHSTVNIDSVLNRGEDVTLSGARPFELPIATIYSKNITPDKETGIGNFTDAEIARVLRYGVYPDGTAVYEFMQFHDASDEDLIAIISYLRSRPPVKNQVPKNKLNLLGNFVKAFLVKPVGPSGEVPHSVPADTSAAYGKYIALSIAECNGCHTKRDIAGRYVGEPFAGGAPIGENGVELVPPNLTQHPTGRIYKWSQQDFIDRFRKGSLIPQSVMPWTSFKNMTDEELKAIYNYLKTVKPAKTAEL